MTDVPAPLRRTADNRRLFFNSGPNNIMSVAIDTKRGVAVGTPTTAYDLNKLRVNLAE